jgi:2-C-methyl-D-erythritol 4-phosphate cytidylyltransferase/2-C-methyl-D-erythritol 2,4-cyclodiphosphate synthase
MSVAAVIVAAGSGLRAGGARPKQYQPIGGRPVLYWTLKAFQEHPGIAHVQPVIGAGQEELYAEAAAGLDVLAPVIGGDTRQASCRIGIEALAGQRPSKVLIHDAARPFASADLISHVIAHLERFEGVVPGLPVADTVKRAPAGVVAQTVSREALWLAQTPQGFRFDAILAAHRAAAVSGEMGFTDDASVAERAGLQVAMIPGRADNRKLTTAQDIIEADQELAAREFNRRPDVRVGQGIDVHGFEKGSAVVLCGISIPHKQRLKGHSDADVAMHALTDAILGAIGEGDIGTLFPPSDPQWKGAASSIFLKKAIGLLLARGGMIAHADVTILAEAPKIAPHVPAMKELLAILLQAGLDRIAIKATTTEKLGFIGRGEGIAALATVTVRLPA